MDDLTERASSLADEETDPIVVDFDRDIQGEDPGEEPAEDAAAEAEGVSDKNSDRSGELEWMYFQSFGKQALLTREGEVVLGKRIERGDRTVRRASRQALAILRGVRLSETMKICQTDLKAVLGVSGLSATDLEKGRRAVKDLIKELSVG